MILLNWKRKIYWPIDDHLLHLLPLLHLPLIDENHSIQITIIIIIITTTTTTTEITIGKHYMNPSDIEAIHMNQLAWRTDLTGHRLKVDLTEEIMLTMPGMAEIIEKVAMFHLWTIAQTGTVLLTIMTGMASITTLIPASNTAAAAIQLLLLLPMVTMSKRNNLPSLNATAE